MVGAEARVWDVQGDNWQVSVAWMSCSPTECGLLYSCSSSFITWSLRNAGSVHDPYSLACCPLISPSSFLNTLSIALLRHPPGNTFFTLVPRTPSLMLFHLLLTAFSQSPFCILLISLTPRCWGAQGSVFGPILSPADPHLHLLRLYPESVGVSLLPLWCSPAIWLIGVIIPKETKTSTE